MQFVSTRGRAPTLGFCDAVLAGLASDGGLYVPAACPQLNAKTIAGFANRPYAEVAYEVISPFVGEDIPADTLRSLIDEAYATFRHPSVTPLVELEPGHFLLELFHGPTLAFKDVAMQFLARVMDHILTERNQHATIVGATSGDTGSAAIEAFRGRDRIDIVILHPEGRTSAVQRKQMTTVLDDNVHNIALQGSFDDCQTAVKSMFANQNLRDAVSLSGVNSINWGRIVAQVVYYFAAAVALGAPHRTISFTVPTGNFGDIFAGFVAKQMGLPIDRLIIATNQNDILTRTLETGTYATGQVHQTISPSMDIQVSSNLERLLFEASDRDGARIDRMMNSLKQSGQFDLGEDVHAYIKQGFAAARCSEDDTKATIADMYRICGYLLDPHSAVGVHVARSHLTHAAPMITLATAHPAKFPEAVKSACGLEPPLPEWLSDLSDREERFDILPNDQSVIEAYVREKSRA